MDKHLWEVDHSYYMNEGNYFQSGMHTEYKRWGEFIEEWGEYTDLDLNYVVRWDWHEGGN
jgi:hypothetical protein